MGDRYMWDEPCPECGENIEVGYAESCGITQATCWKCGWVFDIVMGFKLIKTKKRRKLKDRQIPRKHDK
jgi:hypothetical protein